MYIYIYIFNDIQCYRQYDIIIFNSKSYIANLSMLNHSLTDYINPTILVGLRLRWAFSIDKSHIILTSVYI